MSKERGAKVSGHLFQSSGQEIFYPKRPKLLFLNEAVFHLAERRYVAGILVIMVLHIRLEQWFLTGVRLNPKGSTKLFQGFGGRFPIF